MIFHNMAESVMTQHPPSQQVAALPTCPLRISNTHPLLVSNLHSLDPSHRSLLEYSSLYRGIYAKRYFSNCPVLLELELFDNYNSTTNLL